MRSLAASSGFPAPPAGLTERELQALSLLARGLTDQEMAAVMGVSTATAHEYVEKTRKKLGVKSRAQAAAVGVSLGIICV